MEAGWRAVGSKQATPGGDGAKTAVQGPDPGPRPPSLWAVTPVLVPSPSLKGAETLKVTVKT